MEEVRRQEAELASGNGERTGAESSSRHPVALETIGTSGGTSTFLDMLDGGDWSMPSANGYVWPNLSAPETHPSFPQELSTTGTHEQPSSHWSLPQLATSRSADLMLINAIEHQTAFIEGNPTTDKDLELYYYRLSGSTAIHPGIHRISLKLQRRTADSPLAAAPQPGSDNCAFPQPTMDPPELLWDSSGLPLRHIAEPLFDLFFTHMSQYFPNISRKRMTERWETDTMSAFQANCMCALGARFADHAVSSRTQAAAPFIAKAHELVAPLLQIPTYDVITGLHLLAWANYGQKSESGLWQYSGMAFRMAIDMGVHETSDIYESAAHMTRTKLLFWSLFVTDRIVAFATGRPASIPEDLIEVPLPDDQDFFPDPARNDGSAPPEVVQPVPFVQLVKLMIICGRISDVLNGRRGKARTLITTVEPLSEQLGELQARLVQFVASLPERLKWTASNFKQQQARGHGGVFLALHLWANAVLALVYHPELLKSPSGMETPLNLNMDRSMKLSLASSRQICECMVFADLVDSSAYTSAPFIAQPLHVAGMALVHEMRAAQATASDSADSNPPDVLLLSMARQNFSAILNAIQRVEEYWAGASTVSQLLEQRSGFRSQRRPETKTFISLPDKGILRRFTTDPEHPNDIAPATDTSMRKSIARTERNSQGTGPSPLWLTDLMAGYTVENTSFAPADDFDLERLLAETAWDDHGSRSGPEPPRPVM